MFQYLHTLYECNSYPTAHYHKSFQCKLFHKIIYTCNTERRIVMFKHTIYIYGQMYVYLHRERGRGVNQWLICKGFYSLSLYAEIFDLFLRKVTDQ